MSARQLKLLAAGVVLALGVGVGGGARWVATADAQAPAPGPAPTAEEKVRQAEALLEQAKKELAERQAAERRAADRRMALKSYAELKTARWQYDFVPVRDLDAAGFVKLLGEREVEGWDYGGQTTLNKEAVWVFRRPTGNSTSGTSSSPFGASFGSTNTGASSSTFPRPGGLSSLDGGSTGASAPSGRGTASSSVPGAVPKDGTLVRPENKKPAASDPRPNQ